MSTPSSLPYHEPSIPTILTLASFILLLNIINHLFDRLIYCGLIGQILLGVAFGTPGAKWLRGDVEGVVVDLGYLGLLGVVFEGGLSTSFRTLLPNLPLSLLVALTGILLPIALSYTLPLLLPGTTPLQAFAAGAALCSTSLGTTFTVLNASGLVQMRLGVVLSTAAMVDDVVGLVMVSVISELGGGEGGGGGRVSWVSVVRPVGVSLAFAVLVPLVAWGVVRPVTGWVDMVRERWKGKRDGEGEYWAEKMVASEAFAFTMHTALLLGMVTGATYAGTSNLFAAYLTGACISWWDSEVLHPNAKTELLATNGDTTNQEVSAEPVRSERLEGEMTVLDTVNTQNDARTPALHLSDTVTTQDITSGIHVFEKFYQPALQRILKPFFFASIGFSIPITQMFQRTIVWKGLVYSVLMMIGKLACGMWLVRIPGLASGLRELVWSGEKKNKESVKEDCGLRAEKKDGDWEVVGTEEKDELGEGLGDAVSSSSRVQEADRKAGVSTHGGQIPKYEQKGSDQQNSFKSVGSRVESGKRETDDDAIQPIQPAHASSVQTPKDTNITPSSSNNDNTTQESSPKNPLSLYPPLILGSAMTARGEIGFLISSIAQSNGIFSSSTTTSNSDSSSSSNSSPIFLVVTWAIMLCTIIGPVVVGLSVKRVKSLEKNSFGKGRERDVLGVWGVGG